MTLEDAEDMTRGPAPGAGLRVYWEGQPSRRIRCPICREEAEHRYVLAVESPRVPDELLHLYECGACGAKSFPDVMPPFYEQIWSNPLKHHFYQRYYLQLGSGLDTILSPLFYVQDREAIRSYLEIGCGYPLTLDFAKHALGWEAVGVDPALDALEGAKAMGVKLHRAYLSKHTKLPEGPFDLVMASEVIEHVPDPHAFLEIAVNQVAEDGVLVLTTPNGAGIRQETPHSQLIRILTPNSHLLFFTEETLRALLHEFGFAHVHLRASTDSLLAVASRRPIAVDLEGPLDRERYRRYLEDRCRDLRREPDLFGGFTYRLMKDSVNAGEYETADELFGELATFNREHYGIDLYDPLSIHPAYDPAEGGYDAPDELPVNLCSIAYLRGITLLNHRADPGAAEAYFTLAAEAGDALQPQLDIFGLKDGEVDELRPRALCYAVDAAARQDPQRALARLDALDSRLGESDSPAVQTFYRRFLTTLASDFVNRGQWAAATEGLAFLRARFGETPGAALLAARIARGRVSEDPQALLERLAGLLAEVNDLEVGERDRLGDLAHGGLQDFVNLGDFGRADALALAIHAAGRGAPPPSGEKLDAITRLGEDIESLVAAAHDGQHDAARAQFDAMAERMKTLFDLDLRHPGATASQLDAKAAAGCWFQLPRIALVGAFLAESGRAATAQEFFELAQAASIMLLGQLEEWHIQSPLHQAVARDAAGNATQAT